MNCILLFIPSHPEDKIPNHCCARSVTVRQTLINAQIYSATRSCVEGDALTRRRPRTHREASVLASNDPADTIGRPLLPPRTTREATAVVVAHSSVRPVVRCPSSNLFRNNVGGRRWCVIPTSAPCPRGDIGACKQQPRKHEATRARRRATPPRFQAQRSRPTVEPYTCTGSRGEHWHSSYRPQLVALRGEGWLRDAAAN